MHPTKKVVILGAGFGGLRVALELPRLLKGVNNVEVSIVDCATHHLNTPLLYEVATGYISGNERTSKDETRAEKILQFGVQTSFENFPSIFKKKKIHFVNAEIDKVDRLAREVLLVGGEKLHYDFLVLALGSETDYFGIAGLKEHAIPFKTIEHAFAVRRRVHDFLEAKRRKKEKKITLIIGGGGATGVEVAGEFMGYFKHYIAQGILKPDGLSVMLIEAADRVLPLLDEKLSVWADKRLRKLGVNILINTLIRRAEVSKIIVAPRIPGLPGAKAEAIGPERSIEADIIVWTGGVRATSLLAESGFAVDRKGRVEVESNMLVKGEAGIFAVGDNASVFNPILNMPEPAFAYTAIKQGKVAAENIFKMLRKAKPAVEYKPLKRVNAVVPLGGKQALAHVFGFKFHGFLAWILRQIIDLRYYFSILPPRKAWDFWTRGAKIYFKND